MSAGLSTIPPATGPVLITGGAGFIGTNLSDRLLSSGRPVTVFDNLSRPGVERNLAWLLRRHGSRLRVVQGDIRDAAAVKDALKDVTAAFHFAAQVAVTTSLTSPLDDFEINARGTLNLLEAIRRCGRPVPLVFTSTNKVYGDLDDVILTENETCYSPPENSPLSGGVSEARSIDFHSPYGCSKGAADQYVLDYARTFSLPACVFRMSCIYGPHQFGTEDQGWVAHFLLQALSDEPITLYGDGKQVRDVLFVEDLVEAMLLAQEHMDEVTATPFNIGGGPSNTISLLELLDIITRLHRRAPEVRFADWRAADQRYYVSDYWRFSALTGWRPRTAVRDGITRLYRWLREHGISGEAEPGVQAAAAENIPVLIRG